MNAKVTNEAILSAAKELITSQSNLERKVDELKVDITKVDKKVDLINRKFTIITENQLTQQADIRELQSLNNLI